VSKKMASRNDNQGRKYVPPHRRQQVVVDAQPSSNGGYSSASDRVTQSFMEGGTEVQDSLSCLSLDHGKSLSELLSDVRGSTYINQVKLCIGAVYPEGFNYWVGDDTYSLLLTVDINCQTVFKAGDIVVFPRLWYYRYLNKKQELCHRLILDTDDGITKCDMNAQFKCLHSCGLMVFSSDQNMVLGIQRSDSSEYIALLHALKYISERITKCTENVDLVKDRLQQRWVDQEYPFKMESWTTTELSEFSEFEWRQNNTLSWVSSRGGRSGRGSRGGRRGRSRGSGAGKKTVQFTLPDAIANCVKELQKADKHNTVTNPKYGIPKGNMSLKKTGDLETYCDTIRRECKEEINKSNINLDQKQKPIRVEKEYLFHYMFVYVCCDENEERRLIEEFKPNHEVAKIDWVLKEHVRSKFEAEYVDEIEEQFRRLLDQ
jgi:hypothetical protein